MIQSVIFDWGGTLTPWHSIDVREAWRATVPDPQLADRLYEAELAAWLRCRDEQRSACLEDVFATCGVSPTEAMLAAHHEWWEPHTYLDPDAPAVFAGLRDRGIKVGVLSNTIWPRSVHERIFDRDGVAGLIDAAVYTSEIPWTKPHPEAFRAALDAVGVDDPASAVFVGDRVFDDIHGAKSAGMRAVLVPHSEIPAEQIPTAGEPDATVHRLSELLPLVDGWLASC